MISSSNVFWGIIYTLRHIILEINCSIGYFQDEGSVPIYINLYSIE